MENNSLNSKKEFLKGVFIFFVGLLFVCISAVLYTILQHATIAHLPPSLNGTSSTTPPYQEKDSMIKSVVIGKFQNIVTANQPIPKDIVPLKVTGSFASGYLYVIADVSNRPLETDNPERFDAVFLNLFYLTPN